MVKAFRCEICGTGFSTTGGEAPPSPSWADGHVCQMKEVESKLKTGSLIISKEAKERALGYMKLRKKSQCQGHSEFSDEQEEATEERMKIIAQNGPSGLHYKGEEDDFNG
jgi:hypothetical protein